MRRSQIYPIGLVTLILLFGCWLWYDKVVQTPGRAFSDMLRNNLSTTGLTRVVSQQDQGLSVMQYTQLSLGAQPKAHALTVFKQNGGTLTTEEVSNQTSDYVRYQKIQIPKSAGSKPPDVSSILGKWAKLPAGSTTSNALTSGLFGQSLLGVLPIANLTSAQRGRILQTIRQSGVFSYDAAAVRTVQLHGRRTYQYAVSIKPGAYVTLMQQFEKLLGATTYAAINPATFAKSEPIAVTVDVDARSHQLSQLYQVATQRTEQYEAFGATDQLPLPKATITTAELTKRLAALNQ